MQQEVIFLKAKPTKSLRLLRSAIQSNHCVKECKEGFIITTDNVAIFDGEFEIIGSPYRPDDNEPVTLKPTP